MYDIVWRVSAASFDVDNFLETFGLQPTRVFHQGETEANGKETSGSGFNFPLPRTASRDGISLQLIEFLTHHGKAIEALNEQGITSTIDIGFSVGGNLHYTGSINFPPNLLYELAYLKVHLEISAYPSSED